ncbi:MAG: hypothetical protein KatS3mg082_3376 [Nitrospiraceae bacterium]|nr:MAG: hypothetical protein KatS3mg082_3376 [Nitrospiraceae bacterium]
MHRLLTTIIMDLVEVTPFVSIVLEEDAIAVVAGPLQLRYYTDCADERFAELVELLQRHRIFTVQPGQYVANVFVVTPAQASAKEEQS